MYNESNLNKKGSAVAVGNFDGFHLGHRKLIETLEQIALEKNFQSLIITFSPNPKIYFHKELNLINSDEQKKQILESLGVDQVIFLDFNHVLNLTGETFVKDILIAQYNVKFIVMGENFKFGKNRECDTEALKQMAEKFHFEFKVVSPVILDGTPISSSLIRKKLGSAEIEDSNRMLGRSYYIDGTVIEGDKIGTELGFPTINIQTENEILPEGVFKTRTEICGRLPVYDSISYIGSSPTFYGKKKKVETHILEFDEKIYSRKVRIYFEKKLRGDMKFDSRNALIDQIKKDIHRIKS
ncbi:MAG: bifunctional riboflavin kinase/FAD synthetase [Acidobacteria bacterium]|nr:bifunctional riboflavin kinase/FAD synthetase [Acidobacteriota bacterium]